MPHQSLLSAGSTGVFTVNHITVKGWATALCHLRPKNEKLALSELNEAAQKSKETEIKG